MTITVALLAVGIAAAGALVQGSVGFGLALVAAPVLLLLDPAFVPGPLLVAAFTLTILISLRERRELDFGMLRLAVVGRIAGSAAAAWLLAVLAPDPLAVLFGVLLLLAVAVSLLGVHVEPRTGTILGASTISGFMGTLTAVGGPPMALLYQKSHGPRLRGMLSAYFVVGSLISIGILALAGQFGVRELLYGLVLIPGIALGFMLSQFLTPVLDRRALRPAVLAISGMSAVAVIIRAIL